jgi:HK97 family phage major capsid protein
VKKAFRKNAKWIMSNDTLTAIELLKDGEERFIFRDDLSGEFDGYVLGYPVEVSDNMPEIATGADVIYFGDYSGLALKQRDDALELQVLRERFATQHAIGINAWVEFDAKVENEQKIAKLTMA